MRRAILISVCAVVVGCAQELRDEPTPCEQAAEVVAECTGEMPEPPAVCEGDEARAARAVVEGGCELIAANDSKSDGGSAWCSPYLRWLGRCDLGDPRENIPLIEALRALLPPGEHVGREPGVEPPYEQCQVRVDVAEGADPSIQVRMLYSGRVPLDWPDRWDAAQPDVYFRLDSADPHYLLREHAHGEGHLSAHVHQVSRDAGESATQLWIDVLREDDATVVVDMITERPYDLGSIGLFQTMHGTCRIRP